MFFLVNPKHKRRRRASATRRRSTKRRASGTRKRRRAMPAALKAYWASKRGGRTVARRRKSRRGRRRSTVARNPVGRPRRRHRRSFRRNPGFGRARGILGSAIQGMKCGVAIIAGEGLATTAAGFIPVLGNTGIVAGLKIGLVGTLLGAFGGKFLMGYQREFIGGAWAKAIKTAVPVGSIPLIGPGLAGYTPRLAAPSSMSGYAPRTSGAGMSASDDGSGYSF
jgi:hypothetical protein